jgi:hypothetical protein
LNTVLRTAKEAGESSKLICYIEENKRYSMQDKLNQMAKQVLDKAEIVSARDQVIEKCKRQINDDMVNKMIHKFASN